MEKLLVFFTILFIGCLCLGFVVAKIEWLLGKKGWVDNHRPYGIYEMHIKRPLDFALACFALVILWPILLVIAIAVRINMGTPVFFKQRRPGLGGKIFSIYKFRTMSDARNEDGSLKSDEERLTSFGTWLRRISGDELSELINIIKGDLAIIGPRPLLTEYLDRYSEEQAHRHDVRPGLTGYAQTEGRNLCGWEEKFEKDIQYINHITFLGDCKILLKTVLVVLKREGISSETSATMEVFMGNGNARKQHDMTKLLFTGIGRRVELIQAFRETALVLNKDIKIYGVDMTGTAPALAYCDYVRRIVPMSDPEYIDRLLEICERDSIELVIPTIDTDLLLLAENKERFKAIGTDVMISDPEKIKICRDKNNTGQFFIDCGLSAPVSTNDWEKYEYGYPAFIKPKDGSSSINAYKVENKSELQMYACQIVDYVIQPFVEGREYTIDIFCDRDGNPLSIVPRERLQVRAGEVLKTQICMDKQMIEEARKLCEAFRPCGAITVQLIRDSKRKDWFIEINPRFGGGAPLSMKAGSRSVEYLLRNSDGEKPEPVNISEIADGSIYSRFDQSVCIKGSSELIKGVIFDLDDTLYPERDYIRSGFKAVSDYLGGDYVDALWKYHANGGYAIDELLSDINRRYEKETVLDIYRNHRPHIQLNTDVVLMLETLKSWGIKIGIISDGRIEGQKNKISALGLYDIIGEENIIITDELGGTCFRKPCDIAFRIIQNRWRLPASQIAYIGDNISKDFQAPQQIGMKAVYYRNADGLYYNKDLQIDKDRIMEINNMTISNFRKSGGVFSSNKKKLSCHNTAGCLRYLDAA